MRKTNIKLRGTPFININVMDNFLLDLWITYLIYWIFTALKYIILLSKPVINIKYINKQILLNKEKSPDFSLDYFSCSITLFI